MQTTSALYQRIITTQNHRFESKAVVGGVEYGEEALFSINTELRMFDNDPEIGKAVSGEVELTMLLPETDIPRMGKIEVYVRGRCDDEQQTVATVLGDAVLLENSVSFADDTLMFDSNFGAYVDGDTLYLEAEAQELTSEWIPQGVYYIDTREITRNYDGLDLITLHGYDAMLLAEQDYADTSLTWPARDIDVVNEIAAVMGVEVDSRTADLIKDGYTLPLPASYSMREVLGYIASMYIGCFIMTEEGKLRLVSMTELPGETRYLTDEYGGAIVFGEDRILI